MKKNTWMNDVKKNIYIYILKLLYYYRLGNNK